MERILRESGSCKTIAIPPAMLEFIKATNDKKLDISYGENNTLVIRRIEK